jgi:hypothetical protein
MSGIEAVLRKVAGIKPGSKAPQRAEIKLELIETSSSPRAFRSLAVAVSAGAQTGYVPLAPLSERVAQTCW